MEKIENKSLSFFQCYNYKVNNKIYVILIGYICKKKHLTKLGRIATLIMIANLPNETKMLKLINS